VGFEWARCSGFMGPPQDASGSPAGPRQVVFAAMAPKTPRAKYSRYYKCYVARCVPSL